MFAMNSFVEALDAEGRWESARVEQVLDGNYLVSFVGWSRRYDRWVAPAQLRPTTSVASESDGGMTIYFVFFIGVKVCFVAICLLK